MAPASVSITFDNLGDTTPVRQQGYTVIQSNQISNALSAGILVGPLPGTSDEFGFTRSGTPGRCPGW